MLLDGRGAGRLLLAGQREFGQVGRYVVALDRAQGQAAPVRPGEEPHGVAVIGRPRVGVEDGVGEEDEEPLGGLVAQIGDHGWQDEAVGSSENPPL